jgi:two-component system sensor histidine kinase/response regulator
MVTAYGREEVLKQAEENSFANILIKPVTASMLFDSAVEVLGASNSKNYDVPANPMVELEQLRGARVLIVEDNELNREVALGLLEDAHLSIDLAENGQIALQMVAERQYDLVLMDMQMPVMDGLDATRAIRLKPEFQCLPIIAMTANVMATDRDKCTEAGMNDHLSKPIDPDALFATLLRWIKPRDSRNESPELSGPSSAGSSAAPVTGDVALLISGVDTKTALRRTGGNPKRYEMLLRKFAETKAVDEIQAALAAGDMSTAQRAAHSLKGAAANLGVMAVAEEAAKVETAIETGNGVQSALDSLAGSLSSVLTAIRSALPIEPEARASASASADAASVLEHLTRLQRLLKSDDGEASDFILEAHPALSKVLSGAEISALSGLVGNFDFDGALKCLSGIAARLTIHLE